MSSFLGKNQGQRQRQSQQDQARDWEEVVRQWTQYQQTQQSRTYAGGYTSGYDWSGQGANYGHQSRPFFDQGHTFRSKYEASCDSLGVSYTADKDQIKLAYRKKAKLYHPDINKSPNATQKFQELNQAYEFLTEENIARYKRAA